MAQPGSLEPINPALVAAITDIIKQDERAKLLKDTLVEALAIEAIETDNLENFTWLQDRLQELTANLQAAESSPKFDPLKDVVVSMPVAISSPEDLARVIADHQEWMASVLDPSHIGVKGRANLQGCDLRGVDLSGVNLSCADLRQANLEGAILRKTNLSSAKLQKASLRGADLTQANLRRAYVKEADLRDAILDDVDGKGCDMSVAILRDADWNTKLQKNL